MFLGTISANEGDTVSGRCLIPAGAPVTIVFFCKDGMDISRLQARRGKFSYDLAYSVAGSSGNISCGYMYRNDINQVLNSRLSVARYLKVTGKTVIITERIKHCTCLSEIKMTGAEKL
ncbi:hypothetical protein G0U57_016907 [Chelydra serpentina]|uniref:Uncharacterized protein n=1 Tax=Chelydra serpentina TaxID=8475 RepID=A0A8T1S7E5_CHESE|nr:hypothetical protein G0U57_016907 [Chelydra serpentina]